MILAKTSRYDRHGSILCVLVEVKQYRQVVNFDGCELLIILESDLCLKMNNKSDILKFKLKAERNKFPK